MRQKRTAKSGLGMCPGGKQRMPSPTMIPAIGEGRPTKEWGEELDIEPGKPVGRADGKDDGHKDAEVDRMSGHDGGGPEEVGLVGKITGGNPEGDAVRQGVEFFSDRALDAEPAGNLAVDPVEQCREQDQPRGHTIALEGGGARKNKGDEPAGEIAEGEDVRQPGDVHREIIHQRRDRRQILLPKAGQPVPPPLLFLLHPDPDVQREVTGVVDPYFWANHPVPELRYCCISLS